MLIIQKGSALNMIFSYDINKMVMPVSGNMIFSIVILFKKHVALN
jgi:hypothetical protein